MTLKFAKADSAGDKFSVTRDGVVIGYVIRSSDVVVKRNPRGGYSGTKVLRWKFRPVSGPMFRSLWKTRKTAAEWLAKTVDAVARGEAAPVR